MNKSNSDQNNSKRRIRIQLARTTLKSLANAELKQVQGGVWLESFNPCD
jgi:hypothetical protein